MVCDHWLSKPDFATTVALSKAVTATDRDSSASDKNTRHAGFLAPDSSFLNPSIGTIFWQDKPLTISASELCMDLFAQG